VDFEKRELIVSHPKTDAGCGRRTPLHGAALRALIERKMKFADAWRATPCCAWI
jgi:hypothetical protein